MSLVAESLRFLGQSTAISDRKLREQMQYEIKRLHATLGITFVYVTHDQEEALILSDRVAVMTTRPSKIGETLAIDLPRSRDQLATRGAPRFLELRQHLYGEVRRQPAGANR